MHPSLTLSKIRNLKAQVLEQWVRNDQELSTVALAYTLFEKLVAKRVVAKVGHAPRVRRCLAAPDGTRQANRKVVMCACLLLAYKFNEFNSQRRPIPDVLQDLEELHVRARPSVTHHTPRAMHYAPRATQPAGLTLWPAQGVSPREVLRYEFPVFAWLGFCLHVRTQDMMPHFYRLLKVRAALVATAAGADLAPDAAAATAPATTVDAATAVARPDTVPRAPRWSCTDEKAHRA